MPGRPTNEPSNYWAFGFQSAKDVEATTFHFLRHLDGTGNEVSEEIESVREGGDGQEVGLRYKTAIAMDGQAVANARPEIGHRLVVACLGADSAAVVQSHATPAGSGPANQHTAVPTSTIPYLTIEQYWADEIERVTNAQVTGLDIEFEAGRPLKLTPQFVGGGSVYRRNVASALTATRETGPPFFYPGASVVLDGAANTHVTKGKISIRRGVDDSIRTTGLNREDVVALNFDVEGDLTLKFESATGIYDKAHYSQGGSQIPIDLATTALRLTSYLGAGTTIRMLEVGINHAHITGARVNKLDPDGKTMYIDLALQGYKAATNQVYARSVIASSAALI